MSEPIYRIVLEFETREDAESCLTLLGNWEMQDDELGYTDPPENPFVVYSIAEVGARASEEGYTK